ncbi:MAG: folate-binding protein YgfZ [Natronospirillum sp.]
MSDIIAPLLSKGILEVRGPDASRLLQGQCTADLNVLSVGNWVLGGLCTVKGRLYANFILARVQDDCFWLIMPAEQIDDTLIRLKKYAVFYKTTLSNLAKSWHGLGYFPPVSNTIPAGEITASATEVRISLSDGHQMVWLNALQEDAYERAMVQLEEQASFVTETQWDNWETTQGWVWVTPNTSEAWVPQMIAWDTLGGVSFKKGCFTGQEVVARLHYKGQSKRLLYAVRGSQGTPNVGAQITAPGAPKALGELIRVTHDQTPWIGLAILNPPTDGAATLLVDDSPIDHLEQVN